MTLDDCIQNMKVLFTLLESPEHSKNEELKKVTTLTVYLQCLTIFQKEQITMTVGVGDESGKKQNINLLENSYFIFEKIINKFLPYFDEHLAKEYHETTNIFLNHEFACYPLKLQLLQIEEQLLLPKINIYLNSLDIKISFYEKRYETLIDGLKEENRSLVTKDDSIIKEAIKTCLNQIISVFVLKGEILQLDSYLRGLLENSNHELEKKIVIESVISNSQKFNLSSTDELLLFLDDNEDIFSEQEFDDIRQFITYIPNGIDFYDFKYVKSPLANLIKPIPNEKVETVINFSIPHRYLNSDSKSFTLNACKEYKIIGQKVDSIFQDPIFQSMHSWNIGGIGWNHFCDVEPNHDDSYCHIAVVINGLYAPHIRITGCNIEEVDFSEEEARIGRTYYPHKEYVIEILRKNYEVLSTLIDFKLSNININLFSNYSYRIIEKFNNNIINQVNYALTTPNSFSETAGKFIEKLNSINMASSLVDIRTLLSSTAIKSEKNLAEFTFQIFNIVVKNSIELHGNYSDLWENENTPKHEPQAQITIMGFIRFIFEFMGISIEREPIAATGRIDFLISKTLENNKLVTVPVELKLARYSGISNIEDGINAQLPTYMKDKRSNHGILVVLWFKSASFSNPSNFDSTAELNSHIEKIKQSNRIQHLIINCTKPISPSRLKGD